MSTLSCFKRIIPCHAMAFALVACIAVDAAASAPRPADEVREITAGAAEQLLHLMRRPGFVEAAVAGLDVTEGHALPLSSLIRQQGRLPASVASQVEGGERDLRQLKGLPAEGEPLLQVRMVLPRGMRAEDVDVGNVRVATAPIGDDRSWTAVATHGIDGSVIDINPREPLAFPVMMVEVDTRTALREGLSMVNAGLQARGLQAVAMPQAGEVLEVTRLDGIVLRDDEEPAVLGDAEIFVVESGIQVDAAKPQLRTYEMPWLEHEIEYYEPRMDLVAWNNYRFGVATVQIFEDDGDLNFQKMLVALADAVTVGVGPFQPSVAVIGKISSAVLAAMPGEIFENSVDYVDSLYLIEKGKAYPKLMGARGNAVVKLTPVRYGP